MAESNLKAWQVDDRSTYAGRTAEEAVLAAMADTGYAREDFDDEPSEVGRDVVVSNDDDETTTTVGAILDAMGGPGGVYWTDC